MAKKCKQKEHKWEVISTIPYRCKCTICDAIGKMYKKGILPLKNES